MPCRYVALAPLLVLLLCPFTLMAQAKDDPLRKVGKVLSADELVMIWS